MDDFIFAFRNLICLMMIYGTARKLYVLYGNTEKWNGLGRAMRAEKWAYLIFWSWLWLTPYISILGNRVAIIAIGLVLFITEIRAERTLPKVSVTHDDKRDARQESRDIRQEATDVRQERERTWIEGHR